MTWWSVSTRRRPNGVGVTKTLTFHRGSYLIDVRFRSANRGDGGDPAVRLFSVAARRQAARRAIPRWCRRLPARRVYTEKVEVPQSRVFSDIEKGKADYPKTSNRRLDRDAPALFRGGVAADRTDAAASSTRASSTADLYTAGVIVPAGSIAPGATATVDLRAVRRAAGAGQAREARARPRLSRSTTAG